MSTPTDILIDAIGTLMAEMPNASALDAACRELRAAHDLTARVDALPLLWQSEDQMQQVIALKLVTQARMSSAPDVEAALWAQLVQLLPNVHSKATAEAWAAAASRRLREAPARLDVTKTAPDLSTDPTHPWPHYALLAATLPWSKLVHANDAEAAEQDEIMDMLHAYTLSKHIPARQLSAAWLKKFTKHNPERAQDYAMRLEKRLALEAKLALETKLAWEAAQLKQDDVW